MIRTMMASLVLLAMVSGNAYAMDCDSMMAQASKRIASMEAPGGKRAALTRMALQGYDYCMAGDTLNAERFFKMLGLSGA